LITVHSPRTLEEAVEHLARTPGLVPVAGCTDLMAAGGFPSAGGLLDVTRIAEIGRVEREDAWVKIGAAASFARIEASEIVRAAFPVLAMAAATVGGTQVRNRATLGGNLANASPAGDSLPALLALGAEIVAVGPDGLRSIPHDAFHTGYRKTALAPGEIIAWVRIPLEGHGAAPSPEIQRFRKVGTRRAQAISKVTLALAASREGKNGPLSRVRLAAGSVADRPVRLRKAEEVLEGALPGEKVAGAVEAAARAEVCPIDDVRSTATYRLHVLGRVARRMVLSIE
jgi:CO/xanthine dehydrogenase FAD-binding subunit